MYILTLKDRPDGVFCIKDDIGNQIIPIFESEDDADRYNNLINIESTYPELEVFEISEEAIIHACEDRDQKYAIITQDDFIIPPADLE